MNLPEVSPEKRALDEALFFLNFFYKSLDFVRNELQVNPCNFNWLIYQNRKELKMSTTSQKQPGDLVKITGGHCKGEEGILNEKISKGWNVKLKNGEIVLTSFPFVVVLAKKGEFEENPQTEQPQDSEPIPEAESEIEVEAEIAQHTPENIAKITTLQLRDLAKQRGVSVARTKSDFLKIIKEKNLGEDLERLKGKILFDRVSELHISRLRSKEDLQKLLAQ